MMSSIDFSKCLLHNENGIIFDTDQQHLEKKIYCIKCLAQNYQNLIPIENILDFKRELIQILIQEQKHQNENNIQKLGEIIQSQSDIKCNVDKNIINLNEQIETIHRDSTLLFNLNVDVQDEESFQSIFYQVQQQSQRAFQIKELLNQQLKNLEQVKVYIREKITEIQFENSQQVKEMIQNLQQLSNGQSKNKNVKCQAHTQDGFMIDLNESSAIKGRIACQDCIQNQKISFTKLEEFNIQCQKHLETKKSIIELTQPDCFSSKINLAIEKLNEHITRVQQNLSNLLSELKGLSDTHLDDLSKEQSRNMKNFKDLSQSELIELADEISNKQSLKEYEKKIKQQNQTKIRKCQEALNQTHNDQLKLILQFYQEVYKIELCNKNQNIERIRGSNRLKICSCTIQLQLNNNKSTQSKILDQHCKNTSQKMTYQQISTIKQEKWCFAISFYRDGSQMVVSSNQQIKVFKNQNAQFSVTQTINQGHTENVQCLKFMNRSQRFVSGGKDKQIIVWSLDDKQQYFCEQRLVGHGYGVTCLEFNKEENLLISGSTDDKVRFWTLKNQWEMSETYIQHNSQVQALSLSENQQFLVSCSIETIFVHHIIDRQNLKCEHIQTIPSQFPIYRISFITNNIFVFQCSKSSLQIYQQENNSQSFSAKDQIQISNTEGCCQFSPLIYLSDQGLLLFKSGQNIYLLKRTNNHQFTISERIQYPGIETFAAISQNGQYLSAWNKQLQEIQIRKLV
ncbi:unnamed protein product [Paramecium octaurelia]|uniref:WD domain, G-beta repeat protein n=1 Tax=Paramecium octaurelia TaxID=43137 RepID=A0A8S1XKB5_PAROT|nr:unnamed protein product [Paramecium octaurelia]